MSFTVLERRISPGLVRAATRAPMLVNGRAIRSSGMRRLSRRISVDIAALEKIVESSDAIPAIAVAFHQERVPAEFIGMAVVLAEQIDQKFSGFAG